MRAFTLLVWGLNAIELISALVAMVMFHRYRPAKWRLFPFYLLAIFLFEMTGRILAAEQDWIHLNALMFNYICFPMQFLFFFYMYGNDQYFRNSKFQVKLFAGIYLFAVLADAVFFRDKMYFFHSFSYSIGTILLLILLVQYFYRLSISERILSFASDSMFWFSLGLFIYYVGTMPYWAVRNMLVYQHRDLFFNYSLVVLVLDILMYFLFIVTTLKWKRN